MNLPVSPLMLRWPVVALLALLFSAGYAQAQSEIAATGKTISTGGNGKQILFRDKTSISAGANTTVAVKRADYDAQTGSANVVIEVTKGAFRYVTGDQAGSHKVKTPLSTVGVRGTVIEGYVDVRGYELFALIEGAFEVCTKKGCQQVLQPGTFVVVKPDGTISPPAGLTPALMNAMLLTVPSVDLVLQHFSEIVDSGGDPLIRFRDLNEARAGQTPLPPAPPPPPPHGGGHDHGGHHGGHGGHGEGEGGYGGGGWSHHGGGSSE